MVRGDFGRKKKLICYISLVELAFTSQKVVKKHSLVIWYNLTHRHDIKISNESLLYITPNVPWPAHKALNGDMGRNGSKEASCRKNGRLREAKIFVNDPK
jgi:hypothetical protein